MRRRLQFGKLVNLIVIFIFFITSCVTLTGCFDTSSGGGSGGSSGSSSGSGGSPIDISSPQLQSDDPDDFFSGVILMYDAGYSGEFYDDATDSNKTFYDLIDRQISTYVTHLMYGLNVIYGSDADANLVSTLDRTQDLAQLNSELAALWQGISMLGVKPSTLLNSNVTNTNNLLLNTNDFDNTKETIANSLSVVAGLGNDWLGVRNQFCFDNAIKGGYHYIVDSSNTEYHSGSFDKSGSSYNTSLAWNYDISQSYTNDSIKQAIANIIANNKYESGSSLDLPYEDCLKEIEHLGFSPNNLRDISSYILEVVIGNAYIQDENIRASFATTTINVATTRDDEDLFYANINQHYYRGYKYVVDIMTERMATITIGGLYVTDDNYENSEDSAKLLTYPIMPRTGIEVTKLSEIFSKTNDIGIGEDGNINWGDIDINDPSSSVKDDEYKPVLEKVKLKNVVLMPKLSDKIKKEYEDSLKEKYGSNYGSYADYRFKITSISLGVNGSADMDVDEFILTPYYNIYCGGEEVYTGLVSNEAKNSSNPNIPDNATFYDEYSLRVDYVYSVSNDVASYTVGDSMGDNKFSDYSGVKVYDDDNKVNQEFFKQNNNNNYLILSKGAKEVFGDNVDNNFDTIFNANINDGNFQFVFNGGSDFLQIDFKYFDKNAIDIYKDSASKYIQPQICDLAYFSIWT